MRLTIVRGLPGSGKTRYAEMIAGKTGAIVVEPDRFLVTNGEYQFTESRFASAIIASWNAVSNAGCAGADCIYADVLPTREDIRAVINAYAEGANVRVVCLDSTFEDSCAFNIHHVRLEDIRRMERDWEAWEGEEHI